MKHLAAFLVLVLWASVAQATTTFLLTTGSLQTFTSPADWNNASNSIECIAGGGSGGAGSISTTSGHGTGGGGGEYGITTNVTFAVPGTSFVSYQIGTGGTAITGTNFTTAGNAGTDTWWNGATQGASVLGCIHGNGGPTPNVGNISGGAGGTGGVGTTHNAGGRGGNMSGASGSGSSGGGGAGGGSGAGNPGADSSSTGATQKTAGGSGDAGAGGAGGLAGNNVGSPGQEWDTTHGSGGGGGGNSASGATCTAGAGGNYGGAGGACVVVSNGGSRTSTSGAGIQGIITVIYTPASIGSSQTLMLLGVGG